MVVLGEEKWIVVVVGNLKEIRYKKKGMAQEESNLYREKES